jgi:hypothetical protein
MTSTIPKKDVLATKVSQEIREINNIIRKMKIKTDNATDQNIQQQIIQLLNMYVQNGDKLMYVVLNEIVKAMINDPTAKKVITFEETEVEIPEFYVFFPEYVKIQLSRLEKILTYDEIPVKPAQNGPFGIGTPLFNPVGAPTFHPPPTFAQFNPSRTPSFNPTKTHTTVPPAGPVFNPPGGPAFNPPGGPAFNPPGGPAKVNESPFSGTTFNPKK